MIQHRVYFTETDHGYILCDSEKHAIEIQEHLDNGLPINEVGGSIKYIDGEREHRYAEISSQPHLIDP